MAVTGLASRVATSASSKMNVFNATGKEAATQLAKGITDNQGTISTAVSTATSNAAGSAATGSFSQAGGKLAGAIGTGISGNASAVTEAVSNICTQGSNTANSFYETYKQRGLSLAQAMAVGIMAGGAAVQNAVSAVAGGAGGSGGTKGAARPVSTPTAAENAFIRESAPSMVAASQQASTTYADSFNIVINQQPGQSAEAIVDEIERQLAFRTERRWAAYA